MQLTQATDSQNAKIEAVSTCVVEFVASVAYAALDGNQLD